MLHLLIITSLSLTEIPETISPELRSNILTEHSKNLFKTQIHYFGGKYDYGLVATEDI